MRWGSTSLGRGRLLSWFILGSHRTPHNGQYVKRKMLENGKDL